MTGSRRAGAEAHTSEKAVALRVGERGLIMRFLAARAEHSRPGRKSVNALSAIPLIDRPELGFSRVVLYTSLSRRAICGAFAAETEPL